VALAPPLSADYLPVGPRQVELKAELVGPPPLPFQAARLRLTLHNVSGGRLDGLAQGMRIKPLEAYAGVTVDGRWVPILVADWRRGVVVEDLWSPEVERGYPWLDAGGVTSLSFAIASTSNDRSTKRERTAMHRALFPRPGRYTVRYDYNDQLSATLTVEVPEPEGDDKAVYGLLQRDNVLASAMMSPVDAPGQEVVGKLRDLLGLYPKSSYADYARFALARYHRYGGDFIPDNPRHSDRVEKAIAIDYLTAIVSHTPARTFPYRSYVMIALRTIDAASKDRFDRVLGEEYGDALEWLPVMARTVDNVVDWLKLRVRDR
jgi:hypothetical protein